MSDRDEHDLVQAMLAPLKDVHLEPELDLTARFAELAPLAQRRPDAPTSQSRLGQMLADMLNMLMGLCRSEPLGRANESEHR